MGIGWTGDEARGGGNLYSGKEEDRARVGWRAESRDATAAAVVGPANERRFGRGARPHRAISAGKKTRCRRGHIEEVRRRLMPLVGGRYGLDGVSPRPSIMHDQILFSQEKIKDGADSGARICCTYGDHI